jgi:hypothetical protein
MKRRHVLSVVLSVLIALAAALPIQAEETERLRKVGDTLWKEGPLDSTAVDWSLFPKAYGLLSSERLMYPVDISDWPAKIGPERQLFVDNYLIADATWVKRTVHQLIKYPGNPIMTAQEPWETNPSVVDVVYDRAAKKFRMWYSTLIHFTVPGTNTQARMPTLYAESSDGIHWVRPKLGLLEYMGSKVNNWILYSSMNGIVQSPYGEGHPPLDDPQTAFIANVTLEPPFVETEGSYLYSSPDGIHWTRFYEGCVVPFMHGGKRFPLEGVGYPQMSYDHLLKTYVCDLKILFKPVFRTRGIMTSDDLIHWSRPRMTFYPDVLDTSDAQIYMSLSFAYESMWLGMLRVYQYARAGRKQTDVELTCSRDGLQWSRVANREILLPLGDEESWDRDYPVPARHGPLLINDELWFYYTGSRHTGSDKPLQAYDRAIGLAKLRRDGFVSIDADNEPGTVVTRPLTFAGKHLHLNAKVKQGGWIRVAALDAKDQPIPGYGLQQCRPVTGDSTDVKVNWEGDLDLSVALKSAGHLRLQFQMKKAELYAFWTEK